ncbi:MAG: fused MFS/spermidine synthase [Actinomycetes bacterium]
MIARLSVALVLLTSAAVLVLEILVVRLVAPYVGLTLETYTAAIGVALAAIAAGAAAGGRLADRVDPRLWLGAATALGGVLVLVARPVVLLLGEAFRGTGPAGSLVLVAAAVGPAAAVLSAVPPGVVKLRLRTLAETGETVGRLSAVGTLGALAGTFLTGFVLLTALPTSRLLLVVGGVLVVLGTALAVTRRRVLGVAALAAVAALLGVDSSCDVETRYYCAAVVDDPERAGGRTLVLDGLRHSYVDLDDPAHLEFAYTRRIGDVLAAQPDGPLDVLHLGLGGGSVPRHLAQVRPGSRSVVLEVDPRLVELGRERLDLRTGPDLQVVVGDARTSIADQPDGAYDVVVGDAFGSLAVPWHLTTAEMAAEVRRVLRPGGTYVVNVIDNPPLDFARAFTATLRDAFAEVAVLAPAASLAGDGGGNLVVVASDAGLPVEELARRATRRGEAGAAGPQQAARFAGDAQVLTDDDAPVDQLLTPYRTGSG